MKKLIPIFLIPALFATAAKATETPSPNGCRPGYSNAALAKLQKIAKNVDTRISQSGRDFLLYISISTAKNDGGRSASNTISIEGYDEAYETLNSIEHYFSKSATALCVRPDQGSYYRNTKLPAAFMMDYGIMPGNSYELDIQQPFPMN